MTEYVVLLDEAGNAVGREEKATAHHRETPLHLAFSCYLFDGRGRLLLTQRALHKPTWPGVWTNSFCGHPGPGEPIADAVRRRAEQELGARLESLTLVLPAFRYAATMADGTRENEICPVFVATTSQPVQPEPSEVAAAEWVEWVSFRDDVLEGRRDVSPWCVLQVTALAQAELPDGGFRAASSAELPSAAQPAA